MAKRKTGKAKRLGAEDLIRLALANRVEGGDSLRELAAAAGYGDHSQLSRFVRGQRGLATGAKFDRLLEALGLEICERK